MSASLVGSEMCIRDRVHAVCWRGLPGTAVPTHRQSAIVALATRHRWGSICLLYTSDAADDM
eukprot:2349385-Alexandrium_andersonii.AAC.1